MSVIVSFESSFIVCVGADNGDFERFIIFKWKKIVIFKKNEGILGGLKVKSSVLLAVELFIRNVGIRTCLLELSEKVSDGENVDCRLLKLLVGY